MRRSKTQKIEELVKIVLKEQGLDVKLKELELIKAWEVVIGKNVANATTNLYVKNRKLYVQLRSSIIRNELMLIKTGLIRALNKEVDEQVIDDIVVR
ncbi:DUF721 domain-containing protein [Ancylomarina salipaludis]|uniref:DUF721 domain-containing protein n=1 Tax=Ancylomarina salipaludis TaxID=2501299 RepID=A0A4Q1JPI7_9BACT|nr:DUF721 domain-containing protein [Ancylomarina salipaludis]RXQ96150.1 DUF721 domain-containing protein [Ancylomarina salipaludis]